MPILRFDPNAQISDVRSYDHESQRTEIDLIGWECVNIDLCGVESDSDILQRRHGKLQAIPECSTP